MTAFISAITLAFASLAGLFMFRRNARKLDADTEAVTTSAAAQVLDMMRGLLAEQRIEIDAAKAKASEALTLTQECEARERGLRVEMAEMRRRLTALESTT